MSKYSRFGLKIDAIAQDAFADYRKAQNALTAAEAKKKSAQNAVDAARAELALQEARSTLETARRSLHDKAREFTMLRKEFSETVGADYAANPESVDSNAIELLKSGVIDSTDMTRMYNKYAANGNYTMARLVCKYAGDAAEQRENDGYHGNDSECRSLRYLASLGNQHKGSSHLESFDNLTSIYERCVNNPALMDSWEAFTSLIIANM